MIQFLRLLVAGVTNAIISFSCSASAIQENELTLVPVTFQVRDSGENVVLQLPCKQALKSVVAPSADISSWVIPVDVWTEVFLLLDLADLGRFRQSCRAFWHIGASVLERFLTSEAQVVQHLMTLTRHEDVPPGPSLFLAYVGRDPESTQEIYKQFGSFTKAAQQAIWRRPFTTAYFKINFNLTQMLFEGAHPESVPRPSSRMLIKPGDLGEPQEGQADCFDLQVVPFDQEEKPPRWEVLIKKAPLRWLPLSLRQYESAESTLDKLQVIGCGLRHLMGWIGQFSNLTTLNLARNQLSTLPPEIGHLTKLQHLDLSSNQFKDIPSVVLNLLPKLLTFSIAHNPLQKPAGYLRELYTNLSLAWDEDGTYCYRFVIRQP